MELLVRIVDKRDLKDPVKDAQLTKAGDVIVYRPDGSDWGIEDLKNPDWRIVRVPSMTEEQAIALTSPELPPTLDKQYPLLQKRAMKLDLNTLDQLEAGKVLLPKTEAVASIDAIIADPQKTGEDLSLTLKELAVHCECLIDNVQNCMLLKTPLKE